MLFRLGGTKNAGLNGFVLTLYRRFTASDMPTIDTFCEMASGLAEARPTSERRVAP